MKPLTLAQTRYRAQMLRVCSRDRKPLAGNGSDPNPPTPLGLYLERIVKFMETPEGDRSRLLQVTSINMEALQ